MTTKLEAKAAALTAANCLKARAAGRTHRVQLDTFGPRGAYVETKVFYVTGEPDMGGIAKLALHGGTKSISHSIESAKVSALA